MLKEIHIYKVIIPSKKQQYSFVDREPSFKHTIHPILLENEKQYIYEHCKNCFSVIQKEKEKGSRDNIESYVGKEGVYYQREGIFTNGIHYYAYSEKKKSHKVIKNKIQRFIDKEMGFFGNINLDFIK